MALETIDSGRRYGSSEPVLVRVRHRGDKLTIDDDGSAVRRAGRPTGWLEEAERIVRAVGLNVNRRGVVFVPAVGDERRERLVDQVATTSLALYDALLDAE